MYKVEVDGKVKVRIEEQVPGAQKGSRSTGRPEVSRFLPNGLPYTSSRIGCIQRSSSFQSHVVFHPEESEAIATELGDR